MWQDTHYFNITVAAQFSVQITKWFWHVQKFLIRDHITAISADQLIQFKCTLDTTVLYKHLMITKHCHFKTPYPQSCRLLDICYSVNNVSVVHCHFMLKILTYYYTNACLYCSKLLLSGFLNLLVCGISTILKRCLIVPYSHLHISSTSVTLRSWSYFVMYTRS